MEYLIYIGLLALILGLTHLLHRWEKQRQELAQRLEYAALTDAWADLAGLKRHNGESSEDLRKRIITEFKGGK